MIRFENIFMFFLAVILTLLCGYILVDINL